MLSVLTRPYFFRLRFLQYPLLTDIVDNCITL